MLARVQSLRLLNLLLQLLILVCTSLAAHIHADAHVLYHSQLLTQIDPFYAYAFGGAEGPITIWGENFKPPVLVQADGINCTLLYLFFNMTHT